MKSEHAYRTITEVAELLQVQPSVLRFWETQFSQIKPTKRMGRRYYQSEDIVLLARIRDYLYKDFLTIKGVQKKLKASSSSEGLTPQPNTSENADTTREITTVPTSDMNMRAFVQEITDIKEELAQYL